MKFGIASVGLSFIPFASSGVIVIIVSPLERMGDSAVPAIL
jgi:hypothetical protein